MTRSLYSNLYKAGQVVINQDTRIIDSNELMKKKLQQSFREAAVPLQEGEAEEGFQEGLSAEELDALTSENPVIKGNAAEELDAVKEELERAKAELSEIQRQAQQVTEDARAEAEALKVRAAEEGKATGYQEGYRQGMSEVSALKEECHAKERQLEQEYSQRMNELEPLFVENLTQIYEHIFKVDLSDYSQLVITLLSDAMQKMDSTGNIIVHVAKKQYAAVSEAKKDLLERSGLLAERLDIVPDMTLASSQCMIETQGGVYDCSLDTELTELTKKLTLLSYKGGK